MKKINMYLLAAMSSFVMAEEADKWAHESEVSIVATKGNSENSTYNAKHASSKKFGKNAAKVSGHYLYGETANDTMADKTANNWDIALRYDRYFTDVLTGFFAIQYEGDEPANIDNRINLDLGAKYIWVKNDTMNFFTEAGYRYTKENYVGTAVNLDNEVVEDDDFHKLRLYAEFNYKCSGSVSTKLWVEHLPNFDEFADDYNTNFEWSLAAQMSNTFSLKIAYLGKYDNTPAGAERYDSTYTTALVAKF